MSERRASEGMRPRSPQIPSIERRRGTAPAAGDLRGEPSVCAAMRRGNSYAPGVARLGAESHSAGLVSTDATGTIRGHRANPRKSGSGLIRNSQATRRATRSSA